MVYAQARSPRLGQPTSVESSYVRMFSGDELPESAWEGQLIYRNETQGLQIFNGNAWEDVVGGAAGVLTYVGPTPPLAQHAGDIWFDSSDDNRIYVAMSDGADSIGPGEWEDVSGSPPPLTPTTWIYRQDTAPGAGDTPPPKDNDFWFETPLNKQYYYKASAPGTHWVGVRDTGIASAQSTADAAASAAAAANSAAAAAASSAAAANTAATNAMTAAQTAQATADGAIRTYYASTPPWANGATGHANDAGDMWFDTDDGQAYRWNDTTKLWEVIEDNSIAAALAAAQTAQTTADGKITAYYSIAAPWTSGHATDNGDLWYDTDDKNKPYYWTGSAWVSVQDGTIADAATLAGTANSNAGAAQTTANSAYTLANGKNRVFFAPTAPAGTSYITGDSWYDSDDGYKLYAWNDAADTWDPAELGGPALAADAVTTREISAGYLYAGDIAAGQIAAGTLDSDLIVGASIKTAETGQRVEITGAQGLINYGPDNVPRVILPTGGTDPAVLRGVAEVDSLTVKGDATMQGTTSIATGKDLVLTTGVSPPPVAPSMSMVYATETAADPADVGGTSGSQKWGLVHDGTYWNRLIIKSSDNKYYMQRLSSTGAVISTTNTGIVAQSGPKITFCRYGSRWYFMFRVANAPFAAWQINERDLSFANITSWNYTSNQDTNNLPSIFVRTDASSGTVLTIAQVKSDGSMGFRHYTTAGVLLNTGTHNPSSPYNSVTDLGTAYVGVADYTGGAGKILIPFRKGDYAYCEAFTESSMSPDYNRSFPLCSFSGGIGYDGTNLWSADRDLLTLIKYSTLQYETSSYYFSAGAASTYYNSTDGKETTPGPIRSLASIPKRCSLRVSIGGLAPGADSVRFHYTPSTTLTPFATQPGVGAITVLYTSLGTSGTTPTTSTFTAGSPSRLLAGAAVLLKGDEYGTFAPGDMKMISYVPVEPSGTVIVAGGSWLYCDGALVDKTVYARLYAKILHQYNGNVDPGSNQFRLPDMQSRVPVGFGTFALPGSNEGSVENLRSTRHTHSITAATDHTHGIGGLSTSVKTMQDAQNTATGGTNAGRITGIAGNIDHNHNVTGSLADNGAHSHGGDTGQSPKTGTNHTMPFSTVGFLIKI